MVWIERDQKKEQVYGLAPHALLFQVKRFPFLFLKFFLGDDSQIQHFLEFFHEFKRIGWQIIENKGGRRVFF